MQSSGAERSVGLGGQINEPEVGDLVKQALSLSQRSGAFSSFTAVEGLDPYGRNVVDIYLSEKRKKPRRRISMVDAVQALDELAFAMEPEVVVGYHLVREGDMDSDTLRQTLKNQAEEQRHSILHDQAF